MALVIRHLLLLVGISFVSIISGPAFAAAPSLTIEIGGTTRSLTRDELLNSPAAVDIDVPRDISYGRPMHYRAVPMDILLEGLDLARDRILEAVASDGFIGLLPVDLVLHPSPVAARAYLAIEPAHAPWPMLPGKAVSAGPFYIVWLRPEASGIRSEQWPLFVTSIRGADSPAKRWPALGVDPALPSDDPIRAGQTLFVTQCLVCHKMNGAGSADVGPDLNLPENPTEYFKPATLARYIRLPAAVRRWPKMQMSGFAAEAMSDREINLIIAYLQQMAGRKAAP